MIRNRIKGHAKIRAGDLVPHELNYRDHGEAQQEATKGILGEIGIARSLLVYELPDGRYKLIDGHMRRSLIPDEIVDIEILDVTEEEAKALLASIDPLSEMATTNSELLDGLRNSIGQGTKSVDDLFAALGRPFELPESVAVVIDSVPCEEPKQEDKPEETKHECRAMCPNCASVFMVSLTSESKEAKAA